MRLELRRLVPCLLAAVAVAVWLLWTPEAWAGGEHKVPDLRRDPSVTGAPASRLLTVPITVHIARSGESRGESMHRLRLSVERANQALEPHGIQLVVHRVLVMASGFGTITRRRDHRKLADYASVDGTVHVFLVDRLELGSRLRGDRSVRGMHWRYRGLRKRFRGRQYLVVNSDAPSTTLVHEIGHLFGLEHRGGHRNLMCSCRRGPRQVFTFGQGMEMRRGARAFFRRGLRIGLR